jgi:hypothetical protein
MIIDGGADKSGAYLRLIEPAYIEAGCEEHQNGQYPCDFFHADSP